MALVMIIQCLFSSCSIVWMFTHFMRSVHFKRISNIHLTVHHSFWCGLRKAANSLRWRAWPMMGMFGLTVIIDDRERSHPNPSAVCGVDVVIRDGEPVEADC